MKSLATLIVMLLVGASRMNAQIAVWTFNAAGTAALNPAFTASNLTASVVSFGSSVGGLGNQASGSNCGQSYRSNGFSTSFDANAYWQFTLSPNVGYRFMASSISISARRGIDGPKDIAVRYSLDGYASDLVSNTADPIDITCPAAPVALNFSMSNTTSPVTFRIYFFDTSGGDEGDGNLIVDFLSISGSVTLPVELTAFHASARNGDVRLNWATASERNNDYFSVERSADGLLFDAIGQTSGWGDSNVPKEYTFVDSEPLEGVNYYRLRQVDFDGEYSYSPVVSVEIGPQLAMRLSPVPATDELRVHVDVMLEESAAWQLFDVAGRLVGAGVFEEKTQETRLPVGQLREGVYIIQLTTARQTLTQQFRKAGR